MKNLKLQNALHSLKLYELEKFLSLNATLSMAPREMENSCASTSLSSKLTLKTIYNDTHKFCNWKKGLKTDRKRESTFRNNLSLIPQLKKILYVT